MSVINITSSNFQNEVVNAPDLVLIDFWASWCGPCRMMSPVVDSVAEELEAEGSPIRVGKVNVDEENELAAQFGIMSIPTLLVLKNGEVINKSVGAVPKKTVLGLLGK